MRRRRALFAAAALLGMLAATWAMDWGPFRPSLDADERAVVEQIDAGSLAARSTDAASYVENNIATLLSPGVASAVDGADLARLFEVALEGDTGDQDAVLDVVVAGVAEEGAIHSADLRVVLGEAITERLTWFDARINGPFSYSPGDLPAGTRRDYLAAHDFLREASRDPQVATRLRQAVNEYGQTEVARAPDEGQDRAHRLAQLGRVQAFFTHAQDNAETGDARRTEEADAIDAANAADRVRKADNAVERAVWLALDRFGDPEASDHDALRAAAAGEPFVNGDGELKTDPSESEQQAFRDWALRQTLQGGLTEADANAIAGGAAQLELGSVPALEGRR